MNSSISLSKDNMLRINKSYSISKEQNHLTEAEKLCIENKMVDLHLSLSRQFEMCLVLKENVKVHKSYKITTIYYEINR